MKKTFMASFAALFATKATAGNLAEPMMDPDVVEASTSSSGGGLLIPIMLLIFLAAAASGGGGNAPIVVE